MSSNGAGAGSGRRATLADVARRAGVSTALVSVVVRGAAGASPTTRERILRVAGELGYVPDARARALRQGRSRLLGVMFGVRQPFHADLVEAVYVAAEEAGYDVVLSAVTDCRGEDEAVRTLLADRCEALLLLGPRSSTAWLAEVAVRLPTVVVTRAVRHPSVDAIGTAYARGVALAVDHLADLGHTRVVHVDGGDAAGADQRRRGYRMSMRRRGLPTRILPGGVTERSGAEATAALLEGPELPTGILAFNDRCASGAIDALDRAGLDVPGDVSVVGLEDTHLAGFSRLDLTTVRQDASLLARLAVERAVTRLGTAPDAWHARRIVVPPALVVRGTTGPAR